MSKIQVIKRVFKMTVQDLINQAPTISIRETLYLVSEWTGLDALVNDVLMAEIIHLIEAN